jgi:phosphoglycerate dehydrogenase-like enzyme
MLQVYQFKKKFKIKSLIDSFNSIYYFYLTGLDVTDPEPLPVDHELFKLPNCVITPHIGCADEATRLNMLRITVTNIINGLTGKSLLYQIKAS